MLRTSAILALLLPVACGSSCSTSPPRAWLRYEPSDPSGWQVELPGRLSTTVHGARFVADLHDRSTRIQLTAVNPTGRDLEVAVGPESARGLTAAIGELRARPLERAAVEGVPDFVPYQALQPVPVRAGWQVEFFLDTPLGREPTIGQYLVLELEVRDGGDLQRRRLPLVATNTGGAR